MIYKFGQLFEIIDGDRGKNYPKENELFDDGYCLFLNAGNVTKDGWSFEKNSFITKEKDEQLRKGRVSKGNTVLTTRGTVGNVVFYDDKVKYDHVRINSGMVILKAKNNKIVTDEFIFYLVKNPLVLKTIELFCSGSAQPQLPIKDFVRIKVNLPLVCVQKRIINTLSVYDALIENNKKRIKSLEQMAENLYKEWFVRFRFPRYENAEFENGIPKGWILSTANSYYAKKPRSWHFGNVSEFGEFKRGKNITSTEMIEGDIPVISAGLEPSGYHCDFNVKGKNITVSASGANAGYIKYNLDNIWAADCSYYQDEKYLWYVYNTLKFLQPVLKNMQCGAAQPHVYPKHINHLNVIIPADDIILKYCQIVNPLYDEIKIIHDNNINLIKQRDLLLPRLMSGKLEV